MRALVTNDDGVDSPGLWALARAVVAAGHDVVVAAPADERSGSGAAIGLVGAEDGIEVVPVELEGLEGVPCYAVTGPPALAVMAGRLGGFGEPPEVIVSGINPGPNTGRAVLHSGTVGAALTGANFGVSGLAVSIGAGEPYRWETAAVLAAEALAWLVEAPVKTVLNLNVPNVALEDVLGVRSATLAPFGTVRASLAEAQGERLIMELVEHGMELPAGSDTALVRAGYAAISSIVGIRVAPQPVDVAEVLERRLPVSTPDQARLA